MKFKNIIVLFLMLPLVVLAKPTPTEGLEIVENLPIKVYALNKVADRWEEDQWKSFEKLIEKESSWTNTAQNSKSTAYGLAQFLDATWETVGCKKTKDPYKQIDCAIEYVEQRYETPKLALAFHIKHNWY